MDRWQKSIAGLLLMVLSAMQSPTSNAEPLPTVDTGPVSAAPAVPTVSTPSLNTAPTIGVAASIRPKAETGDGANFQPLSPGSELHANQTVRTGDVGRADLVFIDRSNLTVGPASEVVVDKFVYDPVGSMGQVVVQAPHGEFKFATGTQDRRAYRIKTPYGTLGVAGPD
jgi:hypothetical protein